MESGAYLPGGGQLFGNSFYRPYRRGIGVGKDTVTLRRDPVKHGSMAGQSDWWQHGAALQSISAFFHQFLYKRMAAANGSVGTHTVNGYEDYFFVHVNLLFCTINNKITARTDRKTQDKNIPE